MKIRLCRYWQVLLAAVFYLSVQGTLAQPDGGILEPIDGGDDATFEQAEGEISVDQLTADKLIKGRIKQILENAGQYRDLEVEVNGGLVFLAGVVDEEEYIEWATDIARNVEGVVAVVNRIQASVPAYFSTTVMQQELLKLWFKTLQVAPLVLVGLLVFFIFFFLSRPIANWLIKPISYISRSELIRLVIQRVISLFIILFGLYFFLRIAGLTQIAVAIISGTGVIGLVFGFAFRDIAENFIASLLLSLQRPFRLGDVVDVAGHLGIVRKVTSRGTILVDYDGNHIQIPNATIYKSIIRNLSANPQLRGNFMLGIGYDSSIKQAQELAMKVMLDHHAVLNDPEPQVLVDNLGSSTINLKLYYWIDSHQHNVSKVGSILMRLVLREFEANGLSMPDDARELIFPQGVPVRISDDVPSDASAKTASQDNQRKVIETDKQQDMEGLIDDISSDTNDINKQADNARDPEEGENII